MSPRKRTDNLIPFRRIKTRPLPPLKAPLREPGVGLRVTLGEKDVTKRQDEGEESEAE